MMNESPINDLVAALAKARANFTALTKSKTARINSPKGSYSYKYADIADVIDAVVPALSAEGLVVTQPTFITSDLLMIRTIIAHSSGQFMTSEYPVCSIDGDHKAMGAAMTYARRYALTAMLGIAADEDTDGDGAAQVERLPPPDRSEDAPPPPKAQQTEYRKEPSESAISMGEIVDGSVDLADLDNLKRTSDFVTWWKDANQVDRLYVISRVEFLKRKFSANGRAEQTPFDDRGTVLDAGE